MSDETETLWSMTKDDGGVIRVARWPEGYVVWFDGEIVFRSWKREPERQHVINVIGQVSRETVREIRRALADVSGARRVSAAVPLPDGRRIPVTVRGEGA